MSKLNSILATVLVGIVGLLSCGAFSDGIQNPPPAVTPAFVQPLYKAGRFYVGAGTGIALGAGAGGAQNFIECTYGQIQRDITIDRLGVSVNTLFVGGNVQAAIYTDIDVKPGLFLASTTSSMSTSLVTSVSSPITPTKVGPAGNGTALWFCLNMDNVTSKVIAISSNTDSLVASSIGGSTIANAVGGTVGGLACNGANCTGGSSAFGAWPATLVGSTWADLVNNSAPRIGFRVLSVP